MIFAIALPPLGAGRLVAGKLHPKKSKYVPPAVAAPTRIAESPISRLKRTLDVWEYTAADELIAAYQMAVGNPVSRDAELGLPARDPRPDAADAAAAHRSDLISVYAQWRADLSGTIARKVTTDALIGESSLRKIDARYNWRKGTARKHLVVGVRHFAALRGNVPRRARGWKVAA